MTVAGENLSPGERLLQAREQMGLDLAELAERTKISAASLQAIERDEYHKVSGDLYVKSFLRAYAVEVGLDPEEMSESYLGFTGIAGGGDGEANTGSEEHEVQIRKVGLPWAQISGGIFLLLVFAVAVWWLFLRADGPEVNEPVPQDLPAAEGVSPVESVSLTEPRAGDGLPDTLALGWQISAPDAGAETPAQILVSPPETEAKEEGTLPGNPVTSSPAPEQTPEQTPEQAPEQEQEQALASAPAGNTKLLFHDGRTWPYVARLLVQRPGGFAAKGDGQAQFATARFGDNPQPVPETGVRAGQAYVVREGLAVYWGVQDHVDVKLAHTDGVSLSFNGKAQDLSRFRAGEVILLDASVLENRTGD